MLKSWGPNNLQDYFSKVHLSKIVSLLCNRFMDGE